MARGRTTGQRVTLLLAAAPSLGGDQALLPQEGLLPDDCVDRVLKAWPFRFTLMASGYGLGRVRKRVEERRDANQEAGLQALAELGMGLEPDVE